MATRAIRDTFKNSYYHRFDRISDKKKESCRDRIMEDVFGHARSKSSLVIPRFQNITEGRNTILRKFFYDYDDDLKIVRLQPEAFDFFKQNHKILLMAILLEWAKFLEKRNKSLPMLISKIEHAEMSRGPMTVFRDMFLEYTECCFYCGVRLNNNVEVDHFLPWSYIFEDQPWNLVLACRKCNGKKSASLPQEDFQHKLIRRNYTYRRQIEELDTSLRDIDGKLGWVNEIKNHYTICKEYGFGVIRLP